LLFGAVAGVPEAPFDGSLPGRCHGNSQESSDTAVQGALDRLGELVYHLIDELSPHEDGDDTYDDEF